MTHFLRKMAAAWIILGSVSVGFAQQQMPPIPTDPNVRIGKLDNGLTYYIRHNELPEKRADFYIAQKVGSILEEDILNRRSGEILLVKGKTIDAEDVVLMNKNLIESVTITIPGEEESTTETVAFDVTEAVNEYDRAMKHHLTVHFRDAKLEEAALDRK